MLGRHLWLIAAVLSATFLSPTAIAQTVTFTNEGVDYQLELPSAHWQALPRLDVHEHFDFINGENRANGYLRVREYRVEAGTTPEDLFRREQARTLMPLPGYVGCVPCEGERFDGNMSGAAYAYEYISGGRPMAGRIYYLQVDRRSFYSLHFTGEVRKLQALGGQMDSIARSFRLK